MSITVMLVDDQELFRQGAALILDAQPDLSVVASAGDGVEAIRLANAHRPEVVLIDIRMPEMDGVEATRRLLDPRRVATYGEPPRVIVLTTFRLDGRAAEAIRHGASGFLLKECSPDQLIDAIRTVHAGNAVLSPDDLALLLDASFTAPRPRPHAFQRLTEREKLVFSAVARGLSNQEIAAEVFLAESTVKTHVGAILRKLELRDRVQLVVYAHDHGLS